jgi:hypothetical protein
LNTPEDVDPILATVQPVALVWDLDNTRPGDWSIIQKLRGFPKYSQLPLLLFQENIVGKQTAGGRVTNILLKPAGKPALQHILDLIPQTSQQGGLDCDDLKLWRTTDLISGSG